MSWTVQSRGIAVARNYPDLVITTAHLSKELAGDFPSYLADWLDVSRSTAVSFDELLLLAKSGPRPPTSTSETRPKPDDVPTWLASQEEFVKQSLKLQLAGPGFPFLSDGQLAVPYWSDRHFEMLGVDRWQEEIRSASSFVAEAGWDDVKIDVAAAISMSLDGFFVSRERFKKAATLIAEGLQSHEVPFSQSPELGSITLQQLLQSGIRSTCLVPLAAGVWLGSNSLFAGQIATGFLAVLGGGGMTVCALSTLWVADKILKGIKNLKDADFKPNAFEAHAARRFDSQEEGEK